MGRLVHFEIHVDDMERAMKFYGEVFGWTFEDYSEYAGMPYFGAVTGDDQQMGINGALMQRKSAPPEPNQALNGFACTMGVEDYDSTEAKILKSWWQSCITEIRVARNGVAGILFGHGRKYIWCSSTRSECQIE